MIGGEAAMGVMFSGDALYVMSENEDLDFVIPEEGTNVWIDGRVIPKNAPNKEKCGEIHRFHVSSGCSTERISVHHLWYS